MLFSLVYSYSQFKQCVFWMRLIGYPAESTPSTTTLKVADGQSISLKFLKFKKTQVKTYDSDT